MNRYLKRHSLRFLLCAWIALFFNQSGSAQNTSNQSTNIPALAQGEVLFQKGKYPDALKLYEDVLANPFAPARDIALTKCRIGIIKSIQLDYETSKRYLVEATDSRALSAAQSALCDYALLQLYIQDSLYSEAQKVLERFSTPPMGALYVARIWALGFEVSKKRKDSRSEIIYLQKLQQVMQNNRLEKVEVKVINKVWTLREVNALLGDESPHTTTSNMGNKSLQSQSNNAPIVNSASQNNTSQQTSSSLTKHAPIETFLASLQGTPHTTSQALPEIDTLSQGFLALGMTTATTPSALNRLRKLKEDDPRHMRVGVLLPSGNLFTKFNHRIMLGVSSFLASSAAKGVHYSIIIKTFDPVQGQAEQGCLKLALEDRVHAILGPVSATQTVQALSCSRLFGIPLIPLGPAGFTPEMAHGWMMRPGVLAQSQSRALVKHIAEDVGIKKVQILAPDDAYGMELAAAFEDQARQAQVSVLQRQHYDMTSTVFQAPVAQALGPQDPKSRPEEYKNAVKEAKKIAGEQKRKFDPKEVKLPALVRFDALFLPDSLSRAKMIASTFAYNEAKEIRYVGDLQWTESLNGQSSLADQFLNGARLPKPAEGKFLGFLRTHLGSNKPADLEKQAFDSLIILRHAHYKSGHPLGFGLFKAMTQSDFYVEGCQIYGPVDDKGEPAVKFEIQNYRGGTATAQLLPWDLNKPAETVPAKEE